MLFSVFVKVVSVLFSMFVKGVGVLFSCNIFVWLWHQGSGGLRMGWEVFPPLVLFGRG